MEILGKYSAFSELILEPKFMGWNSLGLFIDLIEKIQLLIYLKCLFGSLNKLDDILKYFNASTY